MKALRLSVIILVVAMAGIASAATDKTTNCCKAKHATMECCGAAPCCDDACSTPAKDADHDCCCSDSCCASGCCAAESDKAKAAATDADHDRCDAKQQKQQMKAAPNAQKGCCCISECSN